MRKMLNELFLHSPLHRVGVQSLLHNQLHGTCPLLPKHPHFTRSAELHPLENTRHATYNPCCGTEGRGFKPRRSPQLPPVIMRVPNVKVFSVGHRTATQWTANRCQADFLIGR